MLSCLNCKSCKMDMQNAVLWCARNQWMSAQGKEKKVTLMKSEIILVPVEHKVIRFPRDYIKHRGLFEMAEACNKMGDYESMEDSG